MFHKESKLVEVCPQCLHGINNSIARLVSDFCGHKKCRICLLQEADGCLKCIRDSTKASTTPTTQPQRKSVITSTHQIKSLKIEDATQVLHKTVENEKEILFPSQWVNKTPGNFIHLKRSISERYFKEGRRNKEDKCCGTDQQCRAAELFFNLPKHIRYFCDLHKTALKDEWSLQLHMTCNEGVEDQLTCLHCNISFENSYKLNRHNRCHTPTSKFQCDVCFKRFKDNYALKTHYRKHTGHKTFTCNYCDAQLTQLWSLKRHLEKHKGERNFPCESCEKRFVSKEDLKRHMVSHSSVKPYLCRSCGAKFKFQRSLNRHSLLHTKGAHDVECNLCGASFKRKDNLSRHLKNTHTNHDSEMG